MFASEIKKILDNFIITALFFAGIYYYFFRDGENWITASGLKELTLADCIYFAFVTQSTCGYGDIAPKNNLLRAVAIAQMMILYIFSITNITLWLNLLTYMKQ